MESRLKLAEVSSALQFLLDFFIKGRHTFSFSLLCLLNVKMYKGFLVHCPYLYVCINTYEKNKSTAAEGFNCFQYCVENQCYVNSYTFKRVINFICKAAKIDVSD